MEARSVVDSGVGLPSSGRSSRGVDEFDSPINTSVADDTARMAASTVSLAVEHPLNSAKETSSSLEVSFANDSSGATEAANFLSKALEPVFNSKSYMPTVTVDEPLVSEHSKVVNTFCEKEDKPNVCTVAQTSDIKQSSEAYSDEVEKFSLESNVERSNFNLSSCNYSLSDRLSEKNVSGLDLNVLENISVESNCLDILERPNVHPSLQSYTDSSCISCATPFPSLANELKQVEQKEQGNTQSVDCEAKLQVKKESHTSTSAPVRVLESLDKVIESLEKIMEPLEVITESNIQFNSAIKSHSDEVKFIFHS